MKLTSNENFLEKLVAYENDKPLVRKLVLERFEKLKEMLTEDKYDYTKRECVKNIAFIISSLETRSGIASYKGKTKTKATLEELTVHIDNWCFQNLDERELDYYAKQL